MRTVKIAQSSKELTKIQKLAYQDTSDCLSLDGAVEEATKNGLEFHITPKDYVILNVHTDSPKVSGNEDYKTMIVIDRNGTKYATGSNSFAEAFLNIYNTMHEDEDDPDYEIKVVRKESNNYKGKYFLTCSIVA